VKITFLGTGTSTGVPVLGCDCEVCRSDDPRDKRLRPSVLVDTGCGNILIDVTPDFRHQMLRAKEQRVDAVIITHEHADHTHGIDDLRPLNYFQEMAIPLYASSDVGRYLTAKFAYCFGSYPNPGFPALRLEKICVNKPFHLLGQKILPLTADHNRTQVVVLRFENWAYCSDVKSFPDASMEQLQDLDLLVLDALREEPHVSHLSIGEALEVVDELRPRRTLFTHMTHDVLHARESKGLPDGVAFAVDGMIVEVD
jgi:phosphoribosyl 1,2-cyclic phosphate phosphodiesterase